MILMQTGQTKTLSCLLAKRLLSLSRLSPALFSMSLLFCLRSVMEQKSSVSCRSFLVLPRTSILGRLPSQSRAILRLRFPALPITSLVKFRTLIHSISSKWTARIIASSICTPRLRALLIGRFRTRLRFLMRLSTRLLRALPMAL